MQGDKIIRLALHAGSWYNQNKVKLAEQLQTNLSKVKLDSQNKKKYIKAIIGPHAGFRYSGPIAAWSYQYLAQQKKQKLRVFLLGPSHYKYLQGISVSSCTQLETPIGNIQVDIKTTAQIRQQIKTVSFSKKDEEKEHSLQMHLPFIRQVFGQNLSIVPIIVGNLSIKSLQVLGKALAKYFDDENTLFIISSDFCHWGDNFDYKPYEQTKGQIWQFIKDMDHKGMGLIQKHDLSGFLQYLNETGNTICGQNPIKLLLSIINNSNFKYETKFVRYDQSEKVKTQSQSSVSYAASITYRI